MKTIAFFQVHLNSPAPTFELLLKVLVFLPMAMDSPTLQKSIIAWSSAHFSLSSKPHLVHALQNRSSALLEVASSLNSTSISSDSDTLLASCLVLCGTEIALGDTDNWYQHLRGAKQIILSAKSTGVGGAELKSAQCFVKERDGQWLLRNFAYHDVLGSLTSNERPLISGSYWLHDERVVVDTYVRIGSRILAMMSEICELDAGSKDPLIYLSNGENLGVPGSGDVEFWQTADDLEFRLQQWTCPAIFDDCLMELAEAYRTSALIALYRKQRFRCANYTEGRLLSLIEVKIASAADQTIAHIQRIPLQSLPECGLLFPLFMAGGDTLEAKHIEIVRLRLQILLENRKFGNIGRATEVLEELWRLRVTGAKGPQGRSLDWMDILQEKDWKLTLV